MKLFKTRLLFAMCALLAFGSVAGSNVFILNKVKPDEGGSIYVQVSYYPIWSPLIPITKSREVQYNEEFTLIGINRIQWIRIRNAKDEKETVTFGATTGQKEVLSRIVSLDGDDRVEAACSNYLAINPGNRRELACFPGYLRKTGARLKNKAIEVDQFIKGLAYPMAFAVTRKPGTGDFIVSELAAGLFGREKFYYYVKGRDLDAGQEGASK